MKSAIADYNKAQIQQDLQKDMPATFEKKLNILSYIMKSSKKQKM